MYSRTLLFASLVLVTSTGRAQSIQQTLHVSVEHPKSSDSNAGTLDSPLKTIGEAVRRAVENKVAFRGTHIAVHPGTYREPPIEFGYTNYPANDPDNMTPIVVEAVEFGQAIVSGSDVWTQWQSIDGTRQYSHTWPYDWGLVPNPWEGARDLAPIARRREMIFVDGVHLTQVLTREELQPGSFYVDEAADLVYVDPPVGIDLSVSRVDVAVRELLWDQNFDGAVTVRGLIFEHAATPWADANAAVRVAGSPNVVFEDVEIRWTNWQGLYLGGSDNVTLRRLTLNHNGGQGFGMFRDRNVLMEDSETSFNNWRGAQAGFMGWSVGNKALSVHGITIRRHKAVSNQSRGLWIDYDNADVVLDAVEANNNALDGVWIEANQGPIAIKNSTFCGNGWSGLRSTYSEHVLVDGNTFFKNATRSDVSLNDSQIIVDGGGLRGVNDFETGETYQLGIKDWTITNNTFIGGPFSHEYANGPTVIDSDIGGSDWTQFLSTLRSDYNTWYHEERLDVFGFPNYDDKTLSQWQRDTGQDTFSKFPTEMPEFSCSIEAQTAVSEIDLVAEALGRVDSVDVAFNSNGSPSAVVRLEAFDLNAPEEARLFINGSEFSVPLGLIGDAEWLSDSLIVDASILRDGDNEVSFAVSGAVGGTTRGFRARNIALVPTNMEVTAEPLTIPEADRLVTLGNYPNPFIGSTTVTFSLPEDADVDIAVYDLLGRMVVQYQRRPIDAGSYRSMLVDASGLPAGSYVYQVTARTWGKVRRASGVMMVAR